MYATINGADLYYEVHGDETDPAILSLHGGPGIGDHQKGMDAFEPLTDEYQLVVYDHRGCGASELTPPYTNEQYADDAEALCEHLDLDPVVLIGGSYGGFIAQEHALAYPERCEGIVLRDTAPSSSYEAQALENAREQFPELSAAALDVPDISREEFMDVMEGTVDSDADFRRIFHGMMPLYAPSIEQFDAEATREAIEEMDFHHETHNAFFSDEYPEMDYSDRLSEIDLPVLVTVGRHDWITPPAAATELDRLLPDSALVVFESSGHSPNLDQQDQYLQRVREFFETIGFGSTEGGAS